MTRGSADRPAAHASSTFEAYADVYDLLYQDKDYAGEAAFVAELTRRFLPDATRRARIIDLACGTGRHAIELARMGFDLTGSDISASMIAMAQPAAARAGFAIPFHVEAIQTCDRIGGQFDIALAMFASLGYLRDSAELKSALAGIHQSLVPGGLFIFDVWNASAVVRDYAPSRTKSVESAAVRATRKSHTSLDTARELATVRFDFVVTRTGAETVTFSEEHVVRFFHPRELTDALETSGFEVRLQCPFLDASRALEAGDWNATFVAQRPTRA